MLIALCFYLYYLEACHFCPLAVGVQWQVSYFILIWHISTSLFKKLHTKWVFHKICCFFFWWRPKVKTSWVKSKWNIHICLLTFVHLVHTHTHTHIYIYIYIYIYIIYHPQTDCFIVSSLFCVTWHAGRIKLWSKPIQHNVRLNILPLSHHATYVSLGVITHYIYIYIYWEREREREREGYVFS